MINLIQQNFAQFMLGLPKMSIVTHILDIFEIKLYISALRINKNRERVSSFEKVEPKKHLE